MSRRRKHDEDCPKGRILAVLDDKLAEGEGSQCAGLDEDDYPCTCKRPARENAPQEGNK
jgi:hypothetical protein